MFLAAELKALGGFTFKEGIGTACVSEKGIEIDPSFWKSLNPMEKEFLLDHEVAHIKLKHGTRFKNEDSLQANKATDLAINSLLYSQYVGKGDPTVLIPTLYSYGYFPNKFDMPDFETAETYLELIGSRPDRNYEILGKSFGSNIGDSLELEKKLDESFGKDADDSLTEFSREILKLKERPRQKFVSLIKELTGNNTIGGSYTLEERWTRNRRMPWSLLPSEIRTETKGPLKKNKLGLFLDFSGSCAAMIGVFQKAAALVPQRYYNVTLFRFANSVDYLEGGEYIGGGTDFRPIEQYEKDFDQIWVFTDGLGPMPTISSPSKWRWFLSGAEIMTKGIKKPSTIHMLSQFADVS